MKIYIAGPMSNVGNFNFPLFDAVAKHLRDEGHEVFSPAEHAREMLGSLEDIQAMGKDELQAARRQLMAREYAWIFANADTMVMLPGWQQSSGARAEHALAEALGLEISELPNVILPADIGMTYGQTGGED